MLRRPRSSGERVAMAAGIGAFAALVVAPFAVLGFAWVARALVNAQLVWSLFPSGRSIGLLANSLGLASAAAALATLFGASLAVWLSGDGPWQRAGRRCYLLPLLIPPYLHALAWMAIVGRRQVLDRVAAIVIGPDRLVVSAYGFWPAAVVLALALAPIVTMLTLAGLGAVEPELLEQASLLRPSWGVARGIVLPLLAPSLLTSFGLVFVLAFVDYGVPSVLQFNVYTMEIYALFSQDNDPLRSAGAALALLLPAAAIVAGAQWAAGSVPLRGEPNRRPKLATAEWPAWSRLSVRAGVLAGTAAVAVPLVVLALRTGGPAVLPVALGGAAHETGLTISLALIVAGLGSPLATLVAIALLRAAAFGRAGWLLCAMPLAIPAPLTGIAWIYLGSQPGLDWTYSTLVPLSLAHLTRLLPFAVFAAATQVRRIDPLFLNAAALHDVGWWRRAWRIHFPLLAPALLLAFFVIFVLSLGELGASLMVAPPGQATLPMRIYNLMHYGASETVAALSLLLLGLAAAACGAVVAAGRVLWPRTA